MYACFCTALFQHIAAAILCSRASALFGVTRTFTLHAPSAAPGSTPHHLLPRKGPSYSDILRWRGYRAASRLNMVCCYRPT